MESYGMGTGLFTPQKGQFVRDVRSGVTSESVSTSVNIAASGNVKDAAGSTVIIELARTPVLDKYGGFIGSFWGALHNRQYKAPAQTVVETNGSAAFAIYDAATDLEKIFESTGSGRYIAKLTDGAGAVLYGWIGGIAVSSNVYTFSIFSGVALGTQNWFQGGSTAFDATKGVVAEIYRYATSFSFGSTDTFTEEVPYHDPEAFEQLGNTEFRLMAGLSNGQYAIDYKEGRVFARKANADDTETVTYLTWAASGGGGLADDAAFTVGTTLLTPVGYLADETAPDSVDEGDVGAARITLDRKQITASEHKEDAAHVTADYGTHVISVRRDTAAAGVDTAGDYQSLATDALSHLWAREGYAPKYEDNTNEKAVVEHRYTKSAVMTTDTQVKGSAGFIHTITFSCADAAPTAGSIIVYDNTAESGTQVYNETFDTTAFRGYSVVLDVTCGTGIYVGFTTTADVNVVVSYR